MAQNNPLKLNKSIMIFRWFKRVVGAILCLGLILWIADKLSPCTLTRYHDTSTVIMSAQKEIVHVFLTNDEKWRIKTTVDEVNPLYIRTLLAREDHRFYSHLGVSPLAILRAMYQAIKAQKIVSGASTVTMQTARLLGPHPRTVGYKILECFRALQLEWHFSKNEILNMYLTLAPFGSNIEGVKAASLAYFNKTPQMLNASEIGLLVAMVQSPNRFRPDRFPENARIGRRQILDLMVNENLISTSEAAYCDKMEMSSTLYSFPRLAPHLAWRLKQRYPQQREIITTIDLLLQKQVETLLENYQMFLPPRANAAIFILDHVHNKPVVYVASRRFMDWQQHGFVDYIKAPRSPGSVLKPFIYALAFDLGVIKPDSYVLDAQRRFGAYFPHNIDKDIHGMIEAKKALVTSLNIPAVALLNEIGVVRFLALLEQANSQPQFPKSLAAPSLPIALGGVSLSLEQLVRLYAGLARKGTSTVFSYIAADQLITSTQQYLFSKRAAEAVTAILTVENNDGRRIAIKTGTSYGHRDALVLGYDNQYVVGIWVGHPDGSPMGKKATGARTAVPLLHKVFHMLPEKQELAVDAQQCTLKKLRQPYYQELALRETVVQLIFPVDNTVIPFISSQTIPCKATGGVRPYTWIVNGAVLVTQWWQQQFFWIPLQPGYYTVTVVDAKGQSATAEVELKI